MLSWADPELAPLAAHAPASWRRRAAHLDPDLTAAVPTYGDNCRTAGRAFSLRRARPGDLIVFCARLVDRERRPGFHLVGKLLVEEVLSDVVADPGPGWWDGNAHLRRARATGRWDSFWVFRGGAGSGLCPRARPFRLEEALKLLGPWEQLPHRTVLQAIASHTRAVRRLEGPREELLRMLVGD